MSGDFEGRGRDRGTPRERIFRGKVSDVRRDLPARLGTGANFVAEGVTVVLKDVVAPLLHIMRKVWDTDMSQ